MSFKNREKFESLVLPHLESMYRFASWLTGNKSDADDVYQEAVVNALRKVENVRSHDARAWLLAIVRNSHLSFLRKRGKMTPIDDQRPEEKDGLDFTDPEVMLIREADYQLVRKCIEQLPPEFREVLLLKEFEDFSYKEIARVTGVPLGTVMSRISRARDRLAVAILAELGPGKE